MIEKGVVFDKKDGTKTILCFTQEAFEELQKRYADYPEIEAELARFKAEAEKIPNRCGMHIKPTGCYGPMLDCPTICPKYRGGGEK